MVVAVRNPTGVLYGQRLPCHAVFIAVLQLLYTETTPQSGFFLKKKPPSIKPVRTYVLENRSSHPAFHPLTTRLFVPNPISASLPVLRKYTIELLYLLRLRYYLLYNGKVL